MKLLNLTHLKPKHLTPKHFTTTYVWFNGLLSRRLAASGLAASGLVLCLGLLFLGTAAQAGVVVQRWVHASGAQINLVSSMGIPMVDVQIDLDAGERRVPAAQTGLAQLTASGMGMGVRASATEKALDENALSEAWTDLGASFSGSASADRMTFQLRSLTYPEVLQQALVLAARELGEPAFTEAVWQRDRLKRIASIKEANTRPGTLAGRSYAQAVYGEHPYGRSQTEEHLRNIQTSDMRSLHAKALRPCYAKVSVVGALDRQAADNLVSALFARLPVQACPSLVAVAEVPALTAASIQRIPFDAAQAQVLLGQPGYKRDAPTHFALLVGNHILGGGGFTSRLMQEVREKRGLTYGVSSNFSPGLHAGAFTIALQTRPDQADRALELVKTVLTDFVDKGPTEPELQAAKANLMGGFALLVDSNRKLLGNIANMAWNNLPTDYLDTWTEQVRQIRVQDVRAAFAATLQPAQMATVVLGGSAP